MQKTSGILVIHTIKLSGEKKKKKKKLKKNKINISVLHKIYLRCTVKVCRYFIYQNKISKFHIWKFCGVWYMDSVSFSTRAKVKNTTKKKRNKKMKKTKIK